MEMADADQYSAPAGDNLSAWTQDGQKLSIIQFNCIALLTLRESLVSTLEAFKEKLTCGAFCLCSVCV